MTATKIRPNREVRFGTMKACTKCGEEKAETEFDYKNKATGRRQASCKRCRREASRAWYLSNRESELKRTAKVRRRHLLEARAMIAEAKDVPCTDCGLSFPKAVMEFDHVRGKKLGNIATLVQQRAGKQILAAEIAKCEVVCANCHRIRHIKPL